MPRVFSITKAKQKPLEETENEAAIGTETNSGDQLTGVGRELKLSKQERRHLDLVTSSK